MHIWQIVTNCLIFKTPCPMSIYVHNFSTPWPWTSNFKWISPTLYNKLWNNNRRCIWRNKIKTKAKPSHDTFKLNTRSIVRFNPQKMQWDHYRMALLSDTRANMKISCHAQIQFFFIKKYWKRLDDQNTRFPPPPTSDNISLLPYPHPKPSKWTSYVYHPLITF